KGANVKALDEDGNNALQLASSSNSPETVEWLINTCKIDIESKGGWYQRTPFLWAAEKGRLDILKFLKSRGANTKALDKDGNNALHLASLYSNSPETVEWLIDIC